MPSYTPPLRDMQFLLHEVNQAVDQLRTMPRFADLDADTCNAVMEEAGKFTSTVTAPLNLSGDAEGCTLDKTNHSVTTPKGFKAAYAQFCEGGWPSLTCDPDYGGQGLPATLGTCVGEMLNASNQAWAMYYGLSHGAYEAIHAHGSDAQKQTFLPKLTSGEWTGTMCLTEPHCGTDLGMLRTKAEPLADGTYKITGNKIFISAGEHAMAANIVHLVLARLPDAPAGVKGISLFIVPKFKVGKDGRMGERNSLAVGSIEHKMGIHASVTCVMNFDGAEGWLIGAANKGLNAMFTMMNTARMAVGVQGLGLIERAYQHSLRYARERLQMRSLSGAKFPDKPADPLIVHADVRRMLLTQKAFAEGGRVLALYAYLQQDISTHSSDEAERTRADELVAFLTPIVKGLLTELAQESTYHAVQIFGGHGYIVETGAEQYSRDARITTLYEGTTQIQANDLIGRKILQMGGPGLKHFLVEISAFCQAHTNNPALGEFIAPLAIVTKEWSDLTQEIAKRAKDNVEEIGATSVDYLFYSGYVALAWCWARSIAALDQSPQSAQFKEAKRHTARFYFTRILPRIHGHGAAIRAGADTLMAMPESQFG